MEIGTLIEIIDAPLDGSKDLFAREEARDNARKRKRAQRLRDRLLRANSSPSPTAETLQQALLDAMAVVLRSGDPRGAAKAIIHEAAGPFADPSAVEDLLTKRLMTRLPKVLDRSR